MGFGHPVYRTDDPRSLMLRDIAEQLGGPLVDFAVEVEAAVEKALADLKPGRELHTNVEYYAGVVMELCGIPRDLFTPTFAAARVVGWCAQYPRTGGRRRSSGPAPATSVRPHPSRCRPPSDLPSRARPSRDRPGDAAQSSKTRMSRTVSPRARRSKPALIVSSVTVPERSFSTGSRPCR